MKGTTALLIAIVAVVAVFIVLKSAERNHEKRITDLEHKSIGEDPAKE